MRENYTNIYSIKQAQVIACSLNTKKSKPVENCFHSYIDQFSDVAFSSSKLLRTSPNSNKDIYFTVKTLNAKTIRSYRRNYSHKSVALYKTKKYGPSRENIEYMSCSFLELDGSLDKTIKTQGDISTLIRKNRLPQPSYVIQTSKGHFHVLWNYNNPIPWTEKNESYWTSQQKRLSELFKQSGYNVDKMASLNPTQNLWNPSQLNPYNFKRHCKVERHKTSNRTSLRAIYRALNGTNILNPRSIPASVKLRRFLRANKTFSFTLAELAGILGTCTKTAQREVRRAVKNGDLQIVRRAGNNSDKIRTTHYESLLFIEQIPERTSSKNTTNYLRGAGLLDQIETMRMKKGFRNKTLFAAVLSLRQKYGDRAPIELIRAKLLPGSRLCYMPDKEFERTLRNGMKDNYKFPLSLSKLQSWGLLKPEHVRKSFLQ